MLIRYERDFWMHVQDDVPPPMDGSDACVKFLNKRYPGRQPDSMPLSKIKLPDSAADLIRQHSYADVQLGVFTEQKQKAANMLKEMLGEHEIGTVNGNIVKWQNVAQERFDAKLLNAEQPEIYAKYTAKSSYRRFTIKQSTVETDRGNRAQKQPISEILCDTA